MSPRLTPLAAALLLVLLLTSCAQPMSEPGPRDRVRTLNGLMTTIVVGDQRFALALFAPPVSMLLIRTGPMFFWVTPSPAMRQVVVQDEFKGTPEDAHLLEVNEAGTVDYACTMRWS